MILAIVDDLLFRGKLEASAAQLGAPLTIADDAGPALSNREAWSHVLIDLNLSRGDALAMIRDLRQAHPGIPVIGYCSHVQQELRQRALEAGCTTVLPRSAFVQQLPELLSGTRNTGSFSSRARKHASTFMCREFSFERKGTEGVTRSC